MKFHEKKGPAIFTFLTCDLSWTRRGPTISKLVPLLSRLFLMRDYSIESAHINLYLLVEPPSDLSNEMLCKSIISRVDEMIYILFNSSELAQGRGLVIKIKNQKRLTRKQRQVPTHIS